MTLSQVICTLSGLIKVDFIEQNKPEESLWIDSGTFFIIPPEFPSFRAKWNNMSLSRIQFLELKIKRRKVIHFAESMGFDSRDSTLLHITCYLLY